MKYPDHLLQLANERAGKDAKLEGLNWGAGPCPATVMFVGEAPGKNEIVNNIPFSGAAGKELMKSLAQIGLSRDEVYITSAVRSRPFGIKHRINKKTGKEETVYPNRKPTQKEIKAHAVLLDYEIETVQPKLIVTLGDVALKRLLGKDFNLARDHGKVFHHRVFKINPSGTGWVESARDYTIIPTYHPAAVFYNRSLTETIYNDFQIIGNELKKEVYHND